VRILGVDPGLTRCGIGVIDVSATRSLTLVDVLVIETSPKLALAQRLLAIRNGLVSAFETYQPQRVALERVFSQHNLRTVMGTAQASGLVLAEAADRGLPIDMHTPSEVKAAVSGSGRANKAQVAAMVGKILVLPEGRLLPDATDALALAICNAWRGGGGSLVSSIDDVTSLTPAQQKWREAERHSRRRG
jgi:crossover junction endodeoxyribonuclease RuvC